MPEQQKLYIVRKEYDGFGGAENVAKRYNDHFSAHFDTDLVYAGANIGDCRFKGNQGLVGGSHYHFLIRLIVF